MGAGYLATASHYAEQRDIDSFTFPAVFAGKVKAAKEAYGLTAEDLALCIHPHPTLAEVVMEAAEDVHGLCVHSAK